MARLNAFYGATPCIAAWLFVLVLGIFLRAVSFEPDNRPAFDEQLYSLYAQELQGKGLAHYPQIVSLYLQQASGAPVAMLPPTRVTFIAAASLWQSASGASSLTSARAVSGLASILTLLISGAFAWRLRDRSHALAVFVLMAVAPPEIYIAHRALIDGFFAGITLLVLWSLWEVLQDAVPRPRTLALYGISLVLLILTKENAAFVVVSLLVLLGLNRWLRLGHVSRPLWLVTLLAPVVGVLLLAVCAGGFETLSSVLTLNVTASELNPYAKNTGDGPWFRYLSDLLLTSPAILILAIGGAFSLNLTNKAGCYLLGFVILTYALMCQVTYGMNLRYAIIWDFPLRFLALLPLFAWAGALGRWKSPFLVIAVMALAVMELALYHTLFVDHVMADPTPLNLMQALRMIQLG